MSALCFIPVSCVCTLILMIKPSQSVHDNLAGYCTVKKNNHDCGTKLVCTFLGLMAGGVSCLGECRSRIGASGGGVLVSSS